VPGPLHGVRVLDLSHNLAGPLTTMHLGDMGAAVIKVERPEGDEWRRHERTAGSPDRSRHHMQVNRNKRAVCLDLTHPDARGVLDDLIVRADVLVTNMRPGVPEALGFGWERASALNPGLVYCAMTAFGAVGPRGGRRGYDLVMEALAGFMPPGLARGDEPPAASPVPIHDTALPLLACTGILAALIERGRTGRGQRLDASMLGAGVALNAHSLVRVESAPGHGTSTFSRALYRPFRTADGWIAVAAYAERLARALCAELGLPGLLEHPPWDDRAERVAREDELVALLEPPFLTRTTAEWDEALAAAGVPAAPVRERDELFDDPQVIAQGLVEVVEDAEVGPVTMASPVVRLSQTPGAIRHPGRHLGEDTAAVLRERGRDDREIARLVAEGAALCRAGVS
jgi:crotonobetainyl-CoA:carnitine CoA-transferase CaiB-like acyl-CoA transferase